MRGTAQYKALDWIVNNDRMKIQATDPDLVQRYVVAVLYYSLGGENWPIEGWLTGGDECHFPGMVCDREGKIIMISLVSRRLTGSIPPEIGHLQDLVTLELMDNGIGSTIPSEMGNLHRLQDLHLEDNDIVGTVPETVCLLRSSGSLGHFLADCDTDHAEVQCDCCDNCGYNRWADAAWSNGVGNTRN